MPKNIKLKSSRPRKLYSSNVRRGVHYKSNTKSPSNPLSYSQSPEANNQETVEATPTQASHPGIPYKKSHRRTGFRYRPCIKRSPLIPHATKCKRAYKRKSGTAPCPPLPPVPKPPMEE